MEDAFNKNDLYQVLCQEDGNWWRSCKISAFRPQGPQFDPSSTEILVFV